VKTHLKFEKNYSIYKTKQKYRKKNEPTHVLRDFPFCYHGEECYCEACSMVYTIHHEKRFFFCLCFLPNSSEHYNYIMIAITVTVLGSIAPLMTLLIASSELITFVMKKIQIGTLFAPITSVVNNIAGTDNLSFFSFVENCII
jgi:hypothetical protein